MLQQRVAKASWPPQRRNAITTHMGSMVHVLAAARILVLVITAASVSTGTGGRDSRPAAFVRRPPVHPGGELRSPRAGQTVRPCRAGASACGAPLRSCRGTTGDCSPPACAAAQRLPEKHVLAGGAAAISEADARALGATEADFVAALSAGKTTHL